MPVERNPISARAGCVAPASSPFAVPRSVYAQRAKRAAPNFGARALDTLWQCPAHASPPTQLLRTPPGLDGDIVLLVHLQNEYTLISGGRERCQRLTEVIKRLRERIDCGDQRIVADTLRTLRAGRDAIAKDRDRKMQGAGMACVAVVGIPLAILILRNLRGTDPLLRTYDETIAFLQERDIGSMHDI